VTDLWDIFNSLCLIQTNNTCGTHVHISPNIGFTIDSAKSVARAALYSESAINSLVPPDRRNNEYCKSLRRDNLNFVAGTAQECIKLVDRCSTLAELVELMNMNNRYWTWNFRNLLQGGKMTVEFRQPPDVVIAKDCLAWAEFVVTFGGAALKTGVSYHALHM
jgi:hypothetical protein